MGRWGCLLREEGRRWAEGIEEVAEEGLRGYLALALCFEDAGRGRGGGRFMSVEFGRTVSMAVTPEKQQQDSGLVAAAHVKGSVKTARRGSLYYYPRLSV